ncbi:hypothetical protein ACSSZE_11270 [Acidithiobacillus caldus]
MDPEPRLLVAYDCHHGSRRRRIRRLLQGESIDGQYSFYEQYPPHTRRQILLQQVREAKDVDDDVWAFAIDPRAQSVALGNAGSSRISEGWVLV